MIIRAITAAVTVAILGTVGAAWAVPEVSEVTMTQRTNSRIVDITYVLGGEDAIVTLSIETNGVAIPDSAVTRLSGDVCKVVEKGSRTITWHAGADWPENVTENAKARVTAWCTDAPPLYCAISLVGGISAAAYPVYYYADVEAVPEGVTSDLYKTYRILMRRIDPTGGAGFVMGSPTSELSRNNSGSENQVEVFLTKGYYAGVYEVTQRQWEQVMGNVRSWPSYFTNDYYRMTRPVETVSYDNLRGRITDNPSINWPSTGLAVSPISFIGKFRAKTGIDSFDLPTEAQWEYACRAGTTGVFNDGSVNLLSSDTTNPAPDARLDFLGRYLTNGGKVWNVTKWDNPAKGCTTENGTATVGSYAPNTWGLYDMHGNVSEWCRDWWANSLPGGTDPSGNNSGSQRILRGGNWTRGPQFCRSAHRDSVASDNDGNYSLGFRLFRTLP